MILPSRSKSEASVDPIRTTEFHLRRLTDTLTKCGGLWHPLGRGLTQLRMLPALPEWQKGKRKPRVINAKALQRRLKKIRSHLHSTPSKSERLLCAIQERVFGRLPPDK